MPNSMCYRMNDGIAYFYEVLTEKTEGKMPIKRMGDSSGKAYFEYISISAEDYQLAFQREVELQVRIRILQNKKISLNNIVKIKDTYYEVWKVRPGVNKYNIPITDITLVVSVEEYEEVKL